MKGLFLVQATLQHRSSRKGPGERAASHDNRYGVSLMRRGAGSTATFFTKVPAASHHACCFSLWHPCSKIDLCGVCGTTVSKRHALV